MAIALVAIPDSHVSSKSVWVISVLTTILTAGANPSSIYPLSQICWKYLFENTGSLTPCFCQQQEFEARQVIFKSAYIATWTSSKLVYCPKSTHCTPFEKLTIEQIPGTIFKLLLIKTNIIGFTQKNHSGKFSELKIQSKLGNVTLPVTLKPHQSLR